MEKPRQVKTLSDLSIEQKIGQMVIAQAFGRFRSVTAGEYLPLKRLVEESYISGFKIYHGNALGTLMLTSHLDAISTIPLFFPADLEMGLGQQITDAPRFPPAAALGAIRNPELAFRSGYHIAQDALRIGINLVFAPLLDLYDIDESYFGLRCISNSPHITAEIGTSFFQGINQSGALSTAKYFPGNGKQQFYKDGSTINNQSRKQMEQREWFPFVIAIQSGVSSIMISHGSFPFLDNSKWDSDAGIVPASLSRQIVNEILRKELGFGGLIITDALNLPFLRKYTMREIAQHAVSAGSDVLVALTSPQDALDAIKGIYDALDKGLVSESQIDESVQRILDKKYQISVHHRLGMQPLHFEENLIGSDETLSVVEEIAQKSITLLKKPKSNFPIIDRHVSFLGILVGSCQTIEQIRPDRWQPWHTNALLDEVNIQWTTIDPSKDIENQLFHFNKYNVVILTPLQSDNETCNVTLKILNTLDEEGFRGILALPLPPNVALKLAPFAWASLWMPDFYQASRQALLSIITGKVQAIGSLGENIS